VGIWKKIKVGGWGKKYGKGKNNHTLTIKANDKQNELT
jgi:hypothetical protein